jgi:Fe(3+) dicitrate transport protein
MRPAVLATLLLATAAAPSLAQPPERPPAEDPEPTEDTGLADLTPEELAALEAAMAEETIEIVDRAPPGAETVLGEEQLERAEQDDVHKILATVAGVYTRDEDGYGLRPNIGMRGAAAERSAKVALLEDGVPIAPAPYSAPAAYYFPLVTRMAKIEVIKGPAAIAHGPNTVGGVVDLHGHDFPAERSGYVDVAGGTDLYGKLHARAGDRGARWAAMAEYVKLRTDGFKDVDGGAPSGFDKDDAQVSARVHSAPSARTYHQLDLRAGWSEEVSHETYLGLTEADFAAAPQRRYVATADDRMDWRHWRARAAHRVELGTRLRVTTTGYFHAFHRAWGKVDAFVGNRDLAGILADPTGGAAAIYYAVLTGAADSSSPEDELIHGTNDRTFRSQGLDSRASAELAWGPTHHLLDAGVRLHHDRADRRRFEDVLRMASGALVPGDRPRTQVLDSRATTTALALYAQDQVRWGRVEVSAGARLELIEFGYVDHLSDAPGADSDGRYAVPIPGGGVQVHATDELTVLAGVHRGFVPTAPSSMADTSPESSVNYEAGARWRSARVSADVLGFFSDYQNLKGTCTLSTGCNPDQLDDEFDGGRVHVWGAEAQLAVDVALPDQLRLPLTAAYTLTRSSFQSGFSSEFAGWGAVMEGDELPYLPHHQLAVQAAVAAPSWELSAGASWRGAARDVPGQGEVADAERIDGLLTVDLAMHLKFDALAELYLTCSNLLDEQVIVARRPYGVRPNAPRLLTVGYKARF